MDHLNAQTYYGSTLCYTINKCWDLLCDKCKIAYNINFSYHLGTLILIGLAIWWKRKFHVWIQYYGETWLASYAKGYVNAMETYHDL